MSADESAGAQFRLPRRTAALRYYFGGFEREPTAREVANYMCGNCAYFALALHREFGYQMVDMAVHIAARDGDGFFWDIRGRMVESELRDGIGDEVRIRDIDEAGVVKLIMPGLLSDAFFDERRLVRARALVRKLTPGPVPVHGM